VKSFISILFLFLGAELVKADCIACWELRKVEITLNNGEQVIGLVQWNDGWLGGYGGIEEWKTWSNRFPENFVFYRKNNDLYKYFFLFSNIDSIATDSIPNTVYIADKKSQRRLNIDDVSSIKSMAQNFKIAGAGVLPVFTTAEIALLKTNPIGLFYYDGGVADEWLISYNPQITWFELQEIGKTQF
jgi:hypothetical protein